jgi:hypothetical protein
MTRSRQPNSEAREAAGPMAADAPCLASIKGG